MESLKCTTINLRYLVVIQKKGLQAIQSSEGFIFNQGYLVIMQLNSGAMDQ